MATGPGPGPGRRVSSRCYLRPGTRLCLLLYGVPVPDRVGSDTRRDARVRYCRPTSPTVTGVPRTSTPDPALGGWFRRGSPSMDGPTYKSACYLCTARARPAHTSTVFGCCTGSSTWCYGLNSVKNGYLYRTPGGGAAGCILVVDLPPRSSPPARARPPHVGESPPRSDGPRPAVPSLPLPTRDSWLTGPTHDLQCRRVPRQGPIYGVSSSPISLGSDTGRPPSPSRVPSWTQPRYRLPCRGSRRTSGRSSYPLVLYRQEQSREVLPLCPHEEGHGVPDGLLTGDRWTVLLPSVQRCHRSVRVGDGW